MATIKLCDWSKERIPSGEDTYTVVVGEHEYEVSEASLNALLEQFDGEAPPSATKIQVVEKVVEREAPPPPLQAGPPGGIQIQGEDPFGAGPESMPHPVQAQADQAPAQDEVTTEADGSEETGLQIEIPENPRQRFKMPSREVADRVVEDATKFEEGSLPTLTMGATAHREAMKRLQALEQREDDKLRRKAPKGVNVGRDLRDKPGYYD